MSFSDVLREGRETSAHVCVCVCVYEREKQRETHTQTDRSGMGYLWRTNDYSFLHLEFLKIREDRMIE